MKKNRNPHYHIEWTDVRDGLFPSLRCALAQMKKMNEENGGKCRNSKRIVEKVTDNFSVNPEELYDSLIDLTDTHSAFALINGYGNVGFPPAEMCYTEMRVSDLYRQITEEYNSTDFNAPLYAPLPMVLTNGILHHKTFIPSHNIGEVVDAEIALIKHPEIETKDLLTYIKGPDLFVGGKIMNQEQLCDVYERGYGIIEIKVDPQTVNPKFSEKVSDFCGWYNLAVRKHLLKKEYKILIKYEAKLFDGKTVKYMSLKDILQNHIDYGRSMADNISDERLCQQLERIKILSSRRKTII